ncbi:MAG: hypothetical protein ACOCWG_00580 [bacterium]
MYSHTFTLKQHTPHIHFQGEQKNATLRATEIKPRFDAFLHKYAGCSETHKIPKCSSNSYNYKLHIVCKKNKEEKKFGHYFGDNTMYKYDTITVTFSSYVQDLCEKIKTYFPIFCITTNFGASANKGYGSFTVAKIDEQDYKCQKSIVEVLKTYTKAEIVLIKENQNQLNTIKYDYQLLKSGKNFKGYEKSTLFLYFIKKVNPSIRWEKRWIKHKIEEKRNKCPLWGSKNVRYQKTNLAPINVIKENGTFKDKNHWDSPPENFEYGFVRALLGLADKHEYLKEFKSNGKIVPNKTEKITISISHDTIQRISSPLYFKVIESYIYLIGFPVNNSVLKEEFTFRIDNEPCNEMLKIPSEFSTKEFLEFAILTDAGDSKIKYKKIF